MRVMIAGPYGGNNLGDEFILSQIIESIAKLGHEIVVTSSDIDYTERTHGVKSIERLDIRLRRFDALAEIAHVDAVIIGGGEQLAEGRLSHGYPVWGLLPNVAHYARSAIRHDKKLMLWGVGVDRMSTPFGPWLLRRYVSRATFTTVRDPQSLKRLLDLGFDESRTCLAADPVWSIRRHDYAGSRDIARSVLGRTGNDGPMILLSPANDRLGALDYLGPLVEGCKAVASANGGTVVLLLMDHQRRNDLALLSRPELQEDATLRHAPLLDFSPTLLSQLFAGADAVIGSRMHALIIAATQGTPWVNVSRGSKMDALGDMFEYRPLRTHGLTFDQVVQSLTTALSCGRENWDLRQRRPLEHLKALAQVSVDSFKQFIDS